MLNQQGRNTLLRKGDRLIWDQESGALSAARSGQRLLWPPRLINQTYGDTSMWFDSKAEIFHICHAIASACILSLKVVRQEDGITIYELV